jgi:two-component system, cell cycle response regulator DivK
MISAPRFLLACEVRIHRNDYTKGGGYPSLLHSLLHRVLRHLKNKMAKSVLLVEDDKYLRDILASMLRFSGYNIVEAASGAEAIEKAVSAQPGLILLDLRLPDMKGLDAVRSIRRNRRSAHIPVIACSAYSGEEREEALRAGMVDYLQKPFSARVGRLVGGS